VAAVAAPTGEQAYLLHAAKSGNIDGRRHEREGRRYTSDFIVLSEMIGA
jgi:hypothetical protein